MNKEFNTQFATQKLRETLNEVKFTIDDSDLYSAVMNSTLVQDIHIKGKDEDSYLETDEETFQRIQAIATDLDKVDALIRLDGIEETSTTSGAGAYLPKATVKKKTDEQKDVEPKLAAGPADIYMKKKWGWKEAPSIPNRESDMFDYRKIYEEDNADPFVGREITLGKITYKVEKRLENGDYKLKSTEEGYPGTTATKHTLKRAEKLNENYSRFKKETRTRTNEQQLHTAMRLAERKIHEANRILEYTSKLRTELTETRVNKNTQKLMERITRGIAEAYGKMKKLK